MGPCSLSLCRLYDTVAPSISKLYAARGISVAARRAQEIMDHLDKLDYVFLGYSVAGFLLCVIAMWRQKPYRQVEAQSFQLRGDPTLHAAQIKGASHGRK
jgi:hypothetical protein